MPPGSLVLQAYEFYPPGGGVRKVFYGHPHLRSSGVSTCRFHDPTWPLLSRVLFRELVDLWYLEQFFRWQRLFL